jgi:hypothetical protein
MENAREALFITGWCSIRKDRIRRMNGDDAVNENFLNFADFIKSLYRKEQVSYPKFYKMDRLSKLGFLCAEMVLKDNPVTERYNKEEIGIVIANSASSLDTDMDYQAMISDRSNYFPSPSVFVYTLPNIVIGEICIRHGIKGENAFFISEKFEPERLTEYVGELIHSSRSKAVLCGWVDILEKQFESLLFTVEKGSGIKKTGERADVPFTTENINLIYHQNRN